jgi:hypothetical protein
VATLGQWQRSSGRSGGGRAEAAVAKTRARPRLWRGGDGGRVAVGRGGRGGGRDDARGQVCISNRCGVTTTRGRDDGMVVVPSATLLHRCYIILTTINASYSLDTPTIHHHSVDADDDTLLVAVVAVSDADDTHTW